MNETAQATDRPARTQTCRGCGQGVYVPKDQDKGECAICGQIAERKPVERRMRGNL